MWYVDIILIVSLEFLNYIFLNNEVINVLIEIMVITLYFSIENGKCDIYGSFLISNY